MLLLGWGLVVAPVVHLLVTHAATPEGHGHSHGPVPAAPNQHGQGSLEHGAALFNPLAAPPTLVLVLVALAVGVVQLPPSPRLAVWPRVEKSQGP